MVSFNFLSFVYLLQVFASWALWGLHKALQSYNKHFKLITSHLACIEAIRLHPLIILQKLIPLSPRFSILSIWCLYSISCHKDIYLLLSTTMLLISVFIICYLFNNERLCHNINLLVPFKRRFPYLFFNVVSSNFHHHHFTENVLSKRTEDFTLLKEINIFMSSSFSETFRNSGHSFFLTMPFYLNFHHIHG